MLKQPIRLKITLLVTGAVATSLLSFQYIATNLLKEDKISYVYDFVLMQVTGAADSVESRIQSLRRIGLLLASSPEISAGSVEGILSELGVESLSLHEARSGADPVVKPELAAGPSAASLVSKFALTPVQEKHPVTVLSSGSNRLYVRIELGDTGAGETKILYARLPLEPRQIAPNTEALELHFLDRQLKSISSMPSGVKPSFPEGEIRSKAEEILSSDFPAGVTDVGSKDGTQWIAAYHRIARGELNVVGFVPRSVAFSAVSKLTRRSLVIGISILVLTVGLTLLLIRGFGVKGRS